MTHNDTLKYEVLSPDEARSCVLAAEHEISNGEYYCLSGKMVLLSLRQSLTLRKLGGFELDPTNPDEVEGFVDAVLGDYDHVSDLRLALSRYTLGYVQSVEGPFPSSMNIGQATEMLNTELLE